MKTYTLHNGSKITVRDDQVIPADYFLYPREEANRRVAARRKQVNAKLSTKPKKGKG